MAALPTRLARLISNVSPNLLTAVAVITAGALLTAGNNDGVYIVVPVVPVVPVVLLAFGSVESQMPGYSL
jgi:hypothetical protein